MNSTGSIFQILKKLQVSVTTLFWVKSCWLKFFETQFEQVSSPQKWVIYNGVMKLEGEGKGLGVNATFYHF